MRKLWLRNVYCATPRRWEQICFFLTGLFVISAYLRISVSPSGAQVARQTETIGAGLRFAEEFRARGYPALDYFLHPVALGGGASAASIHDGLPLLGVIGGFFQAGSPDPWIGVFLTSAFLLAFHLYVAYAELPKLLAAWGAQISRPLCLPLWLSSAAIANLTTVITPESLALPLLVLGAARILTGSKFRDTALGIIWLSLSIASCPALAPGIALVALAPALRESYTKRAPSLLAACALSFVLPIWWHFINASGSLYPPAINPAALAKLLTREVQFTQLPYFLGILTLLIGFYLREWCAIFLFLAALLFSAIAAGPMAALQGAPLAGASLLAVITLARILGATSGHRFLRPILLAAIVWGALFSVRTNIWISGRASQHGKLEPWAFARAARPDIPPGFHVITDDAFPTTKLMLLGRSGKAAGADVYTTCSEASYAALPLALISDRPPPLGQVLCGGRPREIRHVIASGMKWYITLLPAPKG
ncbi:MAG: hypothetical protein EOP11_17605 [Proteobacteria bacterium]|nr:MAG: hypothetical protein EOP11_17605 [Pseudomonadota bacterium]